MSGESPTLPLSAALSPRRSPEYLIEESGEHTIVYPEGWPLKVEAQHIARQDPKATLRRVGAIRKVVAAINEADHGSGLEPDLWALCSEIADALAGIYIDGGESR